MFLSQQVHDGRSAATATRTAISNWYYAGRRGRRRKADGDEERLRNLVQPTHVAIQDSISKEFTIYGVIVECHK